VSAAGVPALAPADPAFAERVRESFGKQGVMALLGARLGRVEAGACEISLDFRPDLAQQHGFFHAGVVATVADSAGGYAAFTLFPAGDGVLSVEFKINLMAPAHGEHILARGEVLRSGKSITVARFDVFVDREGRRTHCATGLQTLMRMVGRAGVTG
jgi:uncharacterized protein (TIGR00369 family)